MVDLKQICRFYGISICDNALQSNPVTGGLRVNSSIKKESGILYCSFKTKKDVHEMYWKPRKYKRPEWIFVEVKT